MHKNSQHSARDSEIVRVSVSLPIAATLCLLTRTARRTTSAEDYFKWRSGASVARKIRLRSRVSRLPGLLGGPINEKRFVTQEYVHVQGLNTYASNRGTYRITARPQFRVKLAAHCGRAARSVAPEIVFGRGRAPSEAAPQSPCGSARAPASLPDRYPNGSDAAG